MSKGPKRIVPIDVNKFEEAASDLNLFHALLLHTYEEAKQFGIEEEVVNELKLQADMIGEILLKFRISVVNGAILDPGGNPQIH